MTTRTPFRKSPKLTYFNCFISQASFVVKTTNLLGFKQKSIRDLKAEFVPRKRKFQDGQKHPPSCQDGNILEWGQMPTLRMTSIQSLWVNPELWIPSRNGASESAIYHQQPSCGRVSWINPFWHWHCKVRSCMCVGRGGLNQPGVFEFLSL